MRWGNKSSLVVLLGTAALIAAIPALGQDNPKSLLPPGFGDPPPVVAEPANSTSQKPVDLLPDFKLKPPVNDGAARAPDIGSDSLADPASAEPVDGEALALQPPPELQDLPPSARRSTAQVGVLEPGEGDLGPDGFGASNGLYLASLMHNLRAPVASRWASILLRRALLSKVNSPQSVNGADWVAERAWLLLRMGEAESARLLVQSVDVDQYTPKLFEVAMQSSLANADPAGLCPLVDGALKVSGERAWPAARAICSALAGESAQASAQIDVVRSRGSGRGIDGLLAEKVVGAGGNTRRAVLIEWDDVQQLTAWRYGMATATGLQIPERLMATVGQNVRAWQARAPLLPIEQRTADANVAAVLGVLSSAALVDHYSAVADATDPADVQGKPFMLLRAAYAGDSAQARFDAMRALWTNATTTPQTRYARLILTARAAARTTPSADLLGDVDTLVGSMLAAGLDIQAARWAKLVSDDRSGPAVRAWGLLAVGTPGKVVNWDRGTITNYQNDAGKDHVRRGQFLFAAMAGLGRIEPGTAVSMADDLSVPIARQTRWTQALNRAVLAREPATVALLCAVGLQNPDWTEIPAVQLFHIVSALRRVGLAGEARMIAAEALTRS